MVTDERQPLMAPADDARPPQRSKRAQRATLTLALACLAMVVGAVVRVSTDGAEDEAASKVLSLSEDAIFATVSATDHWQGIKDVDSGLELAFASHYEKKVGNAIGDKVYDRLYVEKGVETEFFVKGATGAATVTVHSLNESTSERTVVEVLTAGQEPFFTFGDVGTYVVTVVDEVATVEATVYSRLVRRELRDLDDADRTAYFNAVLALYSTSEEEGRELYGDTFHSAAWLVRLHLQGAADKECDHWHDDAGFLNHHIGITMQFEKSLQLIDGSVAAHYWDYTYDRRVHPADWKTNSTIFSTNYYGEAVPQNKNHVVESGRFAYLKLMRNAQNFSDIHNPYGLLRSPWNTNPVPYLMRHSHVVGFESGGYNLASCSDFELTLNATSVPEMAYIQRQLNGQLHGPVHIILGGHWMMGEVEELSLNVSDAIKSACSYNEWLLISKILWREGWLRCPETCSDDTPASKCMCSCPAELYEGYTKQDVLAKLSYVAETSGTAVYCWDNTVGISYDTIFDALCSVGHPGEMFTSSAPQDPIFWPLHGMAERFVQLLRLEDRLGNINLTTTWGYKHYSETEGVSSDTGMVCDWTNVKGMERPHCTRHTTCTGHRAEDILPFDDVFQDSKEYTNIEFWHAVAPDSDKLSYVYDKLLSWPGCHSGTFQIPDNTGTYTGKMD